MATPDNEVILGDCTEVMKGWPEGFVDLVFADPPFNFDKKYAGYDDDLDPTDYYYMSMRWMGEAVRVLRPGGTIWVASPDEHASMFDTGLYSYGLKRRNWVIWHYEFGQHLIRKFGRNKTHLFYFVKPGGKPAWFDRAIRVPSMRQSVYNDKRANPIGRVPGDVWEFPRVCGTFSERVKGHPCQMPITVLERVIKACSPIGGLVLDPFVGTGTTVVVAKMLGRRYLGIDISETYCNVTRRRLE